MSPAFLEKRSLSNETNNDNYQIVKCLFYQLLVYVKIIKTISSVTQQRQMLHFLQYTQNPGHLWTQL